MPYFEYNCKDCRAYLTLCVAENEHFDEVRCPNCDRSNLEVQAFESDDAGGLQAIMQRVADLEARLSRLEKEIPEKDEQWN